MTRGDWAQARWLAARLTVGGAGRTDGMGVLLSHDPVLAGLLKRLGDMVMDEIADGAVTRDIPELFLSSMFMARDGAAAAIAHALLSERLDDRKDAVQAAAMSVSDPELVVRATRDLISAVEGRDDFSVLSSLIASPDADHTMGEALLELRPGHLEAVRVQQELVLRHLNRAGWYPDDHKVLDVFRHIVETGREAGEFASSPVQDPHELLSLYLDGTVAECIEREMGRTAAIVSLCRLLHQQDNDMVGRAIFESTRVSDWRLTHRVLEVAQWLAGPIEADRANHFHLLITPALMRLAGRPDQQHLRRLVELGDACLRAVVGTPGEHTRRYAADRSKFITGRSADLDSAADIVAGEITSQAIWGANDPETFMDGLVKDAEIFEHHGRYLLSGQSVKQYTTQASLVRRRGPCALLVLVDVIIESGDLTYARALLDSVGEVYPLNSMVLEWRHKLATHTANRARAAAALAELRDLWRDDADGAGPLTQIGVLERMVAVPEAADFVRERARRLALVPAFQTWADRLRSIVDG